MNMHSQNIKAAESLSSTDAIAPALAIRGLSVSYGEKPVLFSVDASFPQQTISAIIGPNGAGKSTLLKAALDVVPRLSGTISFFGDELRHARSRIAYVPQRASVDWDFPATVMDVVLMGLYPKVGPFRFFRKRDREKALSALEAVGMEAFSKRQIGQLSGGQQQRVFLARALAQDADLYLMDEPLAGVDAPTEAIVMGLLTQLRDEGRTVIAVHHDLDSVQATFDQVFLLNVKAIAQGPTADIFIAENLRRTYGGHLETVL